MAQLGDFLTAHFLGQVPYAPMHRLQAQLQRARQLDLIGDTILFLEHEPVVTLGRGARAANLLAPVAELQKHGIAVFYTGRGGDVTYHGPGQLVAYPIVKLVAQRCDVRRYVADLEDAMIRTVLDYGVRATRMPGLNGAWIRGDDTEARTREGDEPLVATGPSRDRKIGAVGVRISRWVTMHGLALNITTSLDAYRWIVPCGITDKGVTSLAAELEGTKARVPDGRAVATRVLHYLAARWEQDVNMSTDPPQVPEQVRFDDGLTGFA